MDHAPNRIDQAAGMAGWLVSLAGSGAGHGSPQQAAGMAGWLVSLAGSGAGHGTPAQAAGMAGWLLSLAGSGAGHGPFPVSPQLNPPSHRDDAPDGVPLDPSFFV